MYFEINNSKELVKTIRLLKKVINKKTILPILTQVKVKVRTDKVVFSATDVDVSIEIEMNCKTEGEGSFLIPLRTLENIKSNGIVKFNYENTIEIQKSSGSIKINPDNVEDYPVFPEVKAGHELNEAFIEGLRVTLPAVSTDQTRYVLNGICLQDSIIVATDGKRLHFYEYDNYDLLSDVGQNGVVVPTKVINLLLTAVKSSKTKNILAGIESRVIQKEPAISEIEPKLIKFVIDGITLTSKLIDGKFPEWKSVIPTTTYSTVTIKRDALLEVLIESLEYTDTHEPRVKLYFGDKLDVYTTNSESKYHTDVPLDNFHSYFGLTMYTKYLIDILNVSENEITLKFSKSLMPVLIESNGKKFVVISINEDTVPYDEFCEQEKQKETDKVAVEF